MLTTLIGKEIVTHVLSLRFFLTFILTLLLATLSFTISSSEYEHNLKDAEARKRSYDESLHKIKQKEDWRDVRRALFRNEGVSYATPVPALSSIVQGLTPQTPVAVNATAERVTNIDRAATANPLKDLYQSPDLTYVVGIVLSLLAILFVFDSVSGEKESGTLRLALSNAVPRHTLLLSKWIGGFLVLGAPFVIAFVGGAGYVWSKGLLRLEADTLARLGLLLLIALLYLSVFFNFGLFVSCCTHRSTTSLFLSLLIWVAWVLAVPNLAPVLAKIMSPAPSTVQIDIEKAAIDDETKLHIQRLNLVSSKLWYGEQTEREREKLEQAGHHLKRQWDKLLADETMQQQSLAENLGRISPNASWVYAATALTQTGPAAYQDLMQAYQGMGSQMKVFHDQHDRAWEKAGWGEAPPVPLDSLPRLRSITTTLDESLKDALVDLLLLAIMNVLFFMLAFMTFLRYDVR